jgi:hypothetical protein
MSNAIKQAVDRQLRQSGLLRDKPAEIVVVKPGGKSKKAQRRARRKAALKRLIAEESRYLKTTAAKTRAPLQRAYTRKFGRTFRTAALPKLPTVELGMYGSYKSEARELSGGVSGKFGVLSASRLAKDTVEQNETAQASFLNSFVDPEFCHIGPSDTNDPTVTAVFRSRTAINIAQPYTAGSTAPWPSTAGTDFTMNELGAFGVCITPIYFLQNASATYDTAPLSGFSFDPDNTTPADDIFTPAGTGEIRAWPLGKFNSGFPGATGKWTVTDNSLPVESYRLIGLRATMTVNTSILGAQGVVIGGDGESFHILNGPNYSSVASTGLVQTETPSYLDTIFNTPIVAGENNARLATLGAISQGAIFEAVWLPTNDDATEFKEVIDTFVSGGTSFPSTRNMASVCANQGSLIFILRGLPKSATAPLISVTFNVTMACEISVRPQGSPIGFLINQARFGRRYNVDWSRLEQVKNAGYLGLPSRTWLECPTGRLACGVCKGVCPPARTRTPANTGGGAISPMAMANRPVSAGMVPM